MHNTHHSIYSSSSCSHRAHSLSKNNWQLTDSDRSISIRYDSKHASVAAITINDSKEPSRYELRSRKESHCSSDASDISNNSHRDVQTETVANHSYG